MEKTSLRKAGSVSTEVVGIQYYEYNLSVDEKIHCDRNAANEFDFNAIEVRTGLQARQQEYLLIIHKTIDISIKSFKYT